MNCLLSCEHVRRKYLYTLEAKTANADPETRRGVRVDEWMWPKTPAEPERTVDLCETSIACKFAGPQSPRYAPHGLQKAADFGRLPQWRIAQFVFAQFRHCWAIQDAAKEPRKGFQ